MATVHSLKLADAIALFQGVVSSGEVPADWEKERERGGFFGLGVFDQEELTGFALAESHPSLVHALCVDGTPDACRLLINKLSMMAGERNLNVWVPLARGDVIDYVKSRGFQRLCEESMRGAPSRLYRLQKGPEEREDEGEEGS